MRRNLVGACIVVMLATSGCGEDPNSAPLGPTRDSGPKADVAAVRAVVDDAYRAAVAHDWRRVCALFTARFAAQHVVAGLNGCPEGLGVVTRVEPGYQGLHPERAAEDLRGIGVKAVVISGDFARVAMHNHGHRDPVLLSAIREDGIWKLNEFPAISVPVDLPPTAHYQG